MQSRSIVRRITAPAAVVGALALVAFAVRAWLGSLITTPWIMVDELIYAELGKSIAEHGSYTIRGETGPIYSLVYPVLIAPAWWAASLATTFDVARAINALLMTLTAIPVYLWGRRLVSPWAAVAAAALTLLLPAFVYTGSLMTENAALPAFVLAAFAIAAALERPTQPRQALAIAAIALVCAVRLQGLVLLAVYPTAIVLKTLLDRRANTRPCWRSYWFSLAAIAAFATLAIVLAVLEDRPVSGSLGAYRAAAEADYAFGEAMRWVGYHAAGLALAVAVVPLAALLALLVQGWREGLGPAERAFLAVTAAAIPWLVVSSGVFASRHSLRVQERYLLYLAPLLLLALVLWLEQGRSRTITAAVSAFVPLAAVAALPLDDLVNVSILADTFALHPLLWLRDNSSLGLGGVRALVLGIALVGALLFAFASRRSGRVLLPTLVGCAFVGTTVAALALVRDYSEGLLEGIGAAERPSWVDERLGENAAAGFVWTEFFDPAVLWQAELWNRSVATVYRLDPEPGDLPAAETRIDPATGQLVTERGTEPPSALLLDPTIRLTDEQAVETQPTGLRLFAVGPETRIAERRDGMYADSWLGAELRYSRYACPGPAWIGFALASDPTLHSGPVEAVAVARGRELGSVVVPPGAERFLQVPAESTAGGCDVELRIAPTRIPAEVIPDSTDTRELGLKLYTATYQPR